MLEGLVRIKDLVIGSLVWDDLVFDRVLRVLYEVCDNDIMRSW